MRTVGGRFDDGGMTDDVRTPGTVSVPGAVLSFTVIGDLADATPEAPPLVMGGSPMDSTGFGSLVAALRASGSDRVVVLTDPRNVGRSTRDDPTAAVTPEQHAEDLHALVEALGVGPVDLFASSGAAVNSLFLVAAHPDDVRLLVAHEPPMAPLLPDGDAIGTACDDLVAAYDAEGIGPAMARFIALVMHRGPWTGSDPVPDPATFGLPRDDDRSRDDGLMANMRGRGARASPTWTRYGRRRPGWSSASARSREDPRTGRSRDARRTPSRASSASSRWSSRAGTTASSAGSTARRASPRSSPHGCARYSNNTNSVSIVEI